MIRRTTVVAVLVGACLCLAHAQTSSEERIKAFAKLPDWSGLWEFDAYVGESVGQILSPEGLRRAKVYAAAMHPSFTPAWQPKYDKANKEFEDAVAADPNQPPAPGSPCGEAPFPATMLPGFYEWRVTPEEATLISSQNAVRHIYTDGRPHPPPDELWPTIQGNSIGHWDGNTLVVDTVAIKDPFIFLAVEPFEFAFTTGPLSNELHTVERIRMVNHDELQIQFTMEDPLALTKPIDMTITHERVKNFNLMEDTRNADCDAATDRNPIVNGRFTTIVKPVPPTPPGQPAVDAFMGTWKLNEAKSHIPSGQQKDAAVVFSMVEDTVKVTAETVKPSGEHAQQEWTGKFDGNYYPVIGARTGEAAMTRVDDHTLRESDRKDGKVISTATMVVSSDGQSRTVMRTAIDADGNEVISLRVYDKQ